MRCDSRRHNPISQYSMLIPRKSSLNLLLHALRISIHVILLYLMLIWVFASSPKHPRSHTSTGSRVSSNGDVHLFSQAPHFQTFNFLSSPHRHRIHTFYKLSLNVKPTKSAEHMHGITIINLQREIWCALKGQGCCKHKNGRLNIRLELMIMVYLARRTSHYREPIWPIAISPIFREEFQT